MCIAQRLTADDLAFTLVFVCACVSVRARACVSQPILAVISLSM